MEMVDMTELPGRSGSVLSGSELSWAAVEACTLPTVERPLRVSEFDSLFEEFAEEVVRPDPTHLVVKLSGGHQVAERASRLAAKETACCSFFIFRVVEETGGEGGKTPEDKARQAPPAGRVRLEVDVPAERAAVLSGLAASAEASLGRRAS